MVQTKRKMSARQRELFKRSIVLGLASLFCFMMAAARAMSEDYGPRQPQQENPWDFPEEDEYDVMSYDDHVMAARIKRRVVGERPVYSRRKASRLHDSVTIVVNENTSSGIASKNDLKRDASNEMSLTNWLTPKFSQRGEMAGGSTPTISYSNSRAHKSDSKIDRGQTFSSTLTGEVVWVHSNGYLVVEAKKTVNVNGEAQTVKLTGTVNPANMDSKSTVDAKYLIDMSVVYEGTGPMSRMDKRGWGAKIIDFLNPF